LLAKFILDPFSRITNDMSHPEYTNPWVGQPSSSSILVEETEVGRQADPLPSKRGEIGFIEGVHSQAQHNHELDFTPLPGRHPADDPQENTVSPTSNPPSPSSPPSNDASTSSPSSIHKSRRFLSFFNRVVWGGFRASTLTLFAIQSVLFIATIIGWVFATKLIQRVGSGQQIAGGLSASVFGHVVFVVAVLGQLVFLERRLFRLRGERYSYLHPGEILPRHRGGHGGSPGLAFAPWNRPPLPTYAAALAQSGHGTGDVEDHIIAAPPPPAYGNTRGSTLILSGFMRQSLIAQRPASVYSHTSRRMSSRGHGLDQPVSRPVSYTSVDENNWQDVGVSQDAERTRRLEETLGRLENTGAGRQQLGNGPTAATTSRQA